MKKTKIKLLIGSTLSVCLLVSGCVKPKVDYTQEQLAVLNLKLSGKSEIPEGTVVDEFNGYLWNCTKVAVNLSAQVDKGEVKTKVTSLGRIYRGSAKLDEKGLADTFAEMPFEGYFVHAEVDLPHQIARIAVNNARTDIGGCSTPWFDLKADVS